MCVFGRLGKSSLLAGFILLAGCNTTGITSGAVIEAADRTDAAYEEQRVRLAVAPCEGKLLGRWLDDGAYFWSAGSAGSAESIGSAKSVMSLYEKEGEFVLFHLYVDGSSLKRQVYFIDDELGEASGKVLIPYEDHYDEAVYYKIKPNTLEHWGPNGMYHTSIMIDE